ncbi:uncharacterized protein LOC127106075 [Lathyrus oleraceus]|uniref:Transmembrane protein n=1 Tax=Pisum sativum TaxID=3888 RepID=A0A9D4ZXF1_PEA|nr:uncharacterized protein LOC127106075 [Pisum sativum]KAI5387369.1 hypothetical protein KIW84_073485 [Pisum sativum]
MTMAPKIWDVLCESKRIIYTQPRHYLTLSLIFLLPLSFFSLVFQLIFNHLQQQQPPTSPSNIISLSLFFFLFSSIFTYGAFITIVRSVYHSFFNQTIKFKEAIKSISTSFFPLLATDIVTFVIFFFFFFLLLLLFGVVLFLIVYLGDINLTTHPYFIVLFSMVLTLVLLPLVAYLLVNLSLVKVIVVVESIWGFEPLRRSWKLVKGMKRLILSIFFLFGSLQWMLAWLTRYSWVLILVISPILAMLSLCNIVVITVLYIYCKEKHGELADEEFGKEKDGASLSLIPI